MDPLIESTDNPKKYDYFYKAKDILEREIPGQVKN